MKTPCLPRLLRTRALRGILCLTLALAVLVTPAFALPNAVRLGNLFTPRAQYDKAETISHVLRSFHIDSGRNDDLLLSTYQKTFKTKDALTPAALRAALIDYFAQDAENFELFLHTMLHTYDPYTNYMTEEEYNRSYPESGDFVGIGFAYRPYGPFLIVDEVFPDSPAGRAGMRAGDLIATVAGQDLRLLTEEARDALINTARTENFEAGILREGARGILEMSITPGQVTVPNIEFAVLDDGVGYLRIRRFAGATFVTEMSAAVRAFRSAKATTLILDLRGNPGGGETQLRAALNALIPEEGLLLYTDMNRFEWKPYYSTGGGWASEEMYVLIDGGSASSSEILAGSLSDIGIATLVGTKSYGKGCGQFVYPYGKDYLIVTAMEVALPVTGKYNGVGLTPAIIVEEAELEINLDALTPLPLDAPITDKSPRAAIRALQERLCLMGYLFETPDGVFDGATREALATLCHAMGEKEQDAASVALLRTLDEMVSRMEGAYRLTDAALDAVMDIVYAQKAA